MLFFDFSFSWPLAADEMHMVMLLCWFPFTFSSCSFRRGNGWRRRTTLTYLASCCETADQSMAPRSVLLPALLSLPFPFMMDCTSTRLDDDSMAPTIQQPPFSGYVSLSLVTCDTIPFHHVDSRQGIILQSPLPLQVNFISAHVQRHLAPILTTFSPPSTTIHRATLPTSPSRPPIVLELQQHSILPSNRHFGRASRYILLCSKGISGLASTYLPKVYLREARGSLPKVALGQVQGISAY